MKLLILLLFGFCSAQQLPYPLMMPYNNGSFDSFWDGPQGQKGFWGQLPPQKNNIFNSDWNSKGYKQMYNLNSVAPFQQDRMMGYDSMVPYYTPMQNSQQVFYPNLQTYGGDGQINPHNKDLNSRAYKKIYEDYYDFYSKNLNRVKSLYNKLGPIGDLNDQASQEEKYPESFDYKEYFDGFNELDTLPGPGLPQLVHKGNGRGRYLKQTNINFKDIKKLLKDYYQNNEQLVSLEQQKKEVQQKIKHVKKLLKKDVKVQQKFDKMYGKLISKKKKKKSRKNHKNNKSVI